ncbi:uncharacterized protein PADG_12035 [Paracoccidioides brasiliensis Pb18]|uniref:Uncharacterized protein n=1 Tax=Paracoccidioides brasiliensis (strain Pb18) TaxID=502780 RepID=A0A0A0HU88_PARBD|nr:uncharacterized protein PADG_12035 [Paracoccidioides brasiliensis Pb18]KGM91893.1 hypothetical protein PADG_12035 [Paracoccidioides brasiliensis Pb18]
MASSWDRLYTEAIPFPPRYLPDMLQDWRKAALLGQIPEGVCDRPTNA